MSEAPTPSAGTAGESPAPAATAPAPSGAAAVGAKAAEQTLGHVWGKAKKGELFADELAKRRVDYIDARKAIEVKDLAPGALESAKQTLKTAEQNLQKDASELFSKQTMAEKAVARAAGNFGASRTLGKFIRASTAFAGFVAVTDSGRRFFFPTRDQDGNRQDSLLSIGLEGVGGLGAVCLAVLHGGANKSFTPRI